MRNHSLLFFDSADACIDGSLHRKQHDGPVFNIDDGCSGGAVTSTAAGTDPQLTGTYNSGRYCVNVSDRGTWRRPQRSL
jgi:hypothetical protein